MPRPSVCLLLTPIAIRTAPPNAAPPTPATASDRGIKFTAVRTSGAASNDAAIDEVRIDEVGVTCSPSSGPSSGVGGEGAYFYMDTSGTSVGDQFELAKLAPSETPVLEHFSTGADCAAHGCLPLPTEADCKAHAAAQGLSYIEQMPLHRSGDGDGCYYYEYKTQGPYQGVYFNDDSDTNNDGCKEERLCICDCAQPPWDVPDWARFANPSLTPLGALRSVSFAYHMFQDGGESGALQLLVDGVERCGA